MSFLHADHEAAIFSAEIGDAPSIDLHGLDIHNAIHALDEYLHQQFMQRTPVIKIIHGRGGQKLQHAVKQYLCTHSLVEYARDSQSPSQSGAVTYAVLAKR